MFTAKPRTKAEWRILLRLAKILRLSTMEQLTKLVQCGELLLGMHPLTEGTPYEPLGNQGDSDGHDRVDA